jgi:hypothetical protein
MNTTTNEKVQVWQKLLQIDKALVEKNAVVLDDLLIDDFVGAVPTGASFNKIKYIQHHCENQFGLIQITEEPMQAASIRLYDTTAVINRRVHAHFQLPNGNIMQNNVQRTEVFTKVKDQWLMVSGQGTWVLSPQSVS